MSSPTTRATGTTNAALTIVVSAASMRIVRWPDRDRSTSVLAAAMSRIEVPTATGTTGSSTAHGWATAWRISQAATTTRPNAAAHRRHARRSPPTRRSATRAAARPGRPRAVAITDRAVMNPTLPVTPQQQRAGEGDDRQHVGRAGQAQRQGEREAVARRAVGSGGAPRPP